MQGWIEGWIPGAGSRAGIRKFPKKKVSVQNHGFPCKNNGVYWKVIMFNKKKPLFSL
jgi:hypothetical protein